MFNFFLLAVNCSSDCQRSTIPNYLSIESILLKTLIPPLLNQL